MANPLFDRQPKPGNRGIFGLMNQLRGGNAKAMYDEMYRSSPQFRDFANSMEGKPIEQAYRENGFDYGQFRDMMGR